MPLFFQNIISLNTKLAIWQIEEDESFFLEKVSLQRTITHPHKRLQHLAGRYLLRYLFDDFPDEEIEIASTRKPFLPDEQYHFSISHCGNFAAAIVSKNERVGIDIELINDKVAKIAHKFLNEAETALVNSEWLIVTNSKIKGISEVNSSIDQSLTLFWCAKETIYKWWGNGEVDFKNHIHLLDLDIDRPIFKAVFTKLPVSQFITIHYQVFANLCLTFTHNYFTSQ
ncbi:4'-phosphopantetheinyl transferase family protein [Parasediminibacterium paludis]|uniref:4'-phosphopantetheinyl transferase family protein n=1 Tax=Parasediminibacterium paludis TaxID=908966 RepID=A0ABV8PXR4_9BACT